MSQRVILIQHGMQNQHHRKPGAIRPKPIHLSIIEDQSPNARVLSERSPGNERRDFSRYDSFCFASAAEMHRQSLIDDQHHRSAFCGKTRPGSVHGCKADSVFVPRQRGRRHSTPIVQFNGAIRSVCVVGFHEPRNRARDRHIARPPGRALQEYQIAEIGECPTF